MEWMLFDQRHLRSHLFYKKFFNIVYPSSHLWWVTQLSILLECLSHPSLCRGTLYNCHLVRNKLSHWKITTCPCQSLGPLYSVFYSNVIRSETSKSSFVSEAVWINVMTADGFKRQSTLISVCWIWSYGQETVILAWHNEWKQLVWLCLRAGLCKETTCLYNVLSNHIGSV